MSLFVSTVPGDDAVCAIHQNRVGKAKLPDRACSQRHLRRIMGPGVESIGDQIADRPVLDCQLLSAVHLGAGSKLRTMLLENL